MTLSRIESTARILVIEDDPSISLGLRMNLQSEGYEVTLAEDGLTGLSLAREGFDLVILDVMLPKKNGYEVLMSFRDQGITTPVILLSARGAEVDKVTGLELGAEDYVTKPFALGELLARVRVALRRRRALAAPPPTLVHRLGELQINPATRQVHRDGVAVETTAREFDVLLALLEVKGRVLSRQQIFDIVWGPDHHGSLRTIDNFVAQLRAKLELDPAEPRYLLTVRGVGYRLAM